MSGMRRLAAILFVALAFTTAVASAQPSAPTTVTAAKLTAGFKKATGSKLKPNAKASYAGHYKAYDLGPVSIANKGKYGTFTIYLVTSADVQTDVNDLLADAHSGALGTPGPGHIYWEQNVSAFGDKYWLAKRQYGANVVLYWIGSKPVKKTDATFKRLHLALTKITG
jgi:hypothetical protein